MNQFILDLLSSKGIKRTISATLAAAAYGTQFIPALAPYQPLVLSIAGWFGIAGVGQAAITKLVKTVN